MSQSNSRILLTMAVTVGLALVMTLGTALLANDSFESHSRPGAPVRTTSASLR
jgi:hypothetical protein